MTDSVELRTSKWHGWILCYLTRKCFPSIKMVDNQRNPFKMKFVSSIERVLDKLDINDGYELNLESLKGIFSDHRKVCVISNTENMHEVVESHHQIIVITHDERGNDISIEDNVVINEKIFELRILFETSYFQRNYKWDGRIYTRHGGPLHQSWWVINRRKNISLHSIDGTHDWLNLWGLDVSVYVIKENKHINNMRNELMKYIGGQNMIQCSRHELPLIIDTSNNKCYQNDVLTDRICNQKYFMKCPDIQCLCGLCKKCYKKLISQYQISNQNIFCQNPTATDPPQIERNMEALDEYENEISNEFESDNDSCVTNNELIDMLLQPFEDDDLDNFVTVGEDTDIITENIEYDELPTTTAGDVAFTVHEERPKGQYVSGHVIMNQCGSLLNRNEKQISGYRSQKQFIQRIASTCPGKSLPLLYPEGMMFPSIFWKMVLNCGAILGAIPSGILAQHVPYNGFASMKEHVRNRLTLSGSGTSTNPRYISLMYDVLSNLTLNREDSRIIINRGLVGSNDTSGLQVRSNHDTMLTDNVDNRQMVRNLCASQRYYAMDLFLTFTCNQAEHFGISVIKKWIDGNEWT